MRERKGWLLNTAAMLSEGYFLGAAVGAAAGIFCGVVSALRGENRWALPLVLGVTVIIGMSRIRWRWGRLTVERLEASGNSPEEEAIAAEKLDSIGEALHLLAGHYQVQPEEVWEPGESYTQAVMWYAGYLEEKQAASVGMKETARLIGSLAREYQEMEDVTGQWQVRLKEKLGEKKLALDKLRVRKNGSGRLVINLTVHAMRSRCIPTKEVTAVLNHEVGRSLKPNQDAKVVIGREPCTICYREDTAFHMMYEVAKAVKEDSGMSGDNFSCIRLAEGKAIFGLSDGMGSGEAASGDSEDVMELAEKLLSAGYDEEAVARLINAILVQKGNRRPVTLDLATVDLYTGACCFAKLGAMTTFLRRNGSVELIESDALPAGILPEADPMTEYKMLEHGDMIVMVTDGVLDALELGNREELLAYLVSETTSDNPKEVAGQILQIATEMGGQRMDDMTVLAAGIWRK